MFWPCETRTSICRNLATISSGLYRFLSITVLLDVKDIPQVGPLQWGWINRDEGKSHENAKNRDDLQASDKSDHPVLPFHRHRFFSICPLLLNARACPARRWECDRMQF